MTPLRDENVALPAASAYDAEPLEVPVPPASARATIAGTYTLSTAGGATGSGFARLRPEVKVNGRWCPDPAILSFTVVDGYQRNVLGGVEVDLPVPETTTVDFFLPFELRDGAEAIRCPASEQGDATHVGKLALAVCFGKGR